MSEIKFDVPFNGDLEILDVFKEFRSSIEMVYGRAEDGFPQGRNTTKRKPITLDDISTLIEGLKDLGIKFNYILNGISHQNKEFDPVYRKTFVKMVRDVADRGADIVTIGNPFLMEVVKDKIPNIEIAASVILEPDNLTRVKQLSKAGAKYICLSKVLLKNFDGLKNIIENFPKDSEPLLLANDPCLHHCALTQYHNIILSNFSMNPESTYTNYCRLHCTQDFAYDPRKVISASFIRPEDVSIYAGMGFNLFKLCDRKQTTDWLRNVFEAYVSGTFDGNLSDLMAPWSNIGDQYPFPSELSQDDFETNEIQVLRSNLRFSPHIDNRSLDGYLSFWQTEKSAGCANEECNACNYCGTIANKAYDIDKERNRIVVQNTEQALKHTRGIGE